MTVGRPARELSTLEADRTPEADKLARFQAITDAALSQLGVEDLLTELLGRIRDLLAVDIATVFLLDSAGTELIATAASGLREEIRRGGVRIPIGSGFAGRVAAQRRPLILDHVDSHSMANPALATAGVTALVGVPLIRTGTVVGVLQVGSTSPRTFTPDDVELLQLVADRASAVVQDRAARLDRAAALALQRSLLPDRPLPIPGLDLASRYLPGNDVGVGGDWYDLFVLPNGHIGVTIGDVAGSGLRAAVVMGRIRSALRAYALETLDPADVLTRLDHKILVFEPEAMATVLYAVIAPDHASMTVSNAGHMPPVLRRPGEPNRLLWLPADAPVGAFPATPRQTTSHAVPDGGALLFYTDGLVEVRGHSVIDGIEQLAEGLAGDSADALCLSAITTMLADREATDDVALLALRRTR